MNPATANNLGDRIATLFFRIQAASHELLTLIHTFDEAGAWHGTGFKSCAHWLSWRTGCSPGVAREKVRVAHALAGLPCLSEAMAHGRLSYCKARALTRVATPENEEELLGFALHGTVAHVERLVRGWRRIERQEDVEDETLRHESRYLNVYPTEEGMYEVRGRLDPEVGAMLMKAIEAASQELFREDPQEGAEQRRADALGLMLREGGVETEVVVHVTDEGGATVTEEGVHVPYETSERLTCDCVAVEVTKDATGRVLDVGRRRRTPPRRMRLALEVRDGCCRFPGCGVKVSHCESHHVKHWRLGGETKLENLTLLCGFHHRAVHEGGFSVELDEDGEAVFRRPDGGVIPAVGDVGEPARTGEGLAAPEGIGPWTGASEWHGERVDLGWALQWFLRPEGEEQPPTAV